MVIAAIRDLELEYLIKILDWGQSQSRYIFSDSHSTSNSFWLWFHDSDSNSRALLMASWCYSCYLLFKLGDQWNQAAMKT
jgi:hypothetical protein